jgi:hypothetical protein
MKFAGEIGAIAEILAARSVPNLPNVRQTIDILNSPLGETRGQNEPQIFSYCLDSIGELLSPLMGAKRLHSRATSSEVHYRP